MEQDRLVAYLDGYLAAAGLPDLCPNGLQVEGRPEIRKLVTGVSACRELFVRAGEAGADAVLVHHGLFWEGSPRVLTGVQYGRVAELLARGLALIAYHLPLDAHPEVGNNAVAARRLGLEELAPFGVFDGRAIGYKGRFPRPRPVAEIVASCAALFGQPPQLLGTGPPEVTTMGIVSGAAERALHQAIQEGLDLFLTGEASEWVTNVAREAGIHFVAAGHYATERLGVQALGDHLAERFGLEVEFVDVPNPV